MTMSIAPWFLQAIGVAEAQRLNFKLHYMGADVYIPGHYATITRVARQSLLQHLWYLTGHLVILAFSGF